MLSWGRILPGSALWPVISYLELTCQKWRGNMQGCPWHLWLSHSIRNKSTVISGVLSGTSNIPFYPLCIPWGVSLLSLLLVLASWSLGTATKCLEPFLRCFYLKPPKFTNRKLTLHRQLASPMLHGYELHHKEEGMWESVPGEMYFKIFNFFFPLAFTLCF